MKRFVHYALMFIIGMLGANTVSSQATTLIVASDSPYPTIQAALDAATDGDTIEVHSGIYGGAFEVDKSVQLMGIDMPILDGEGVGSTVIITADDVLFSGFTIRNTGTNNSHEDSGIIIQADRVTVENNVLEDVLFGIYFADAADGIARNNVVRGYDFEPARRGDGMRVWFSTNVLLENNDVAITRDILIWYADDITIRGNTFTDGRYGLHFMYSDDAWVENNHFTHNSVGTYLMYSSGLRVFGNDLSYNRGPSGYGIALKDMDDVIMSDNWFVGNRVGLYLDNSPSLYEGTNDISANVFAYNDIGIAQLPNVERNNFQQNIFLDNTQQVSVNGRGDLQGNSWTQDGIGNYWSDYAGYDANHDTIGDMSYRAEKLFETLTDDQPELRFFIYSPASQALDFAASAFPSLRPAPRLVDTAPLTQYTLPDATIVTPTNQANNLWVAALILLILGSLPLLASLRLPNNQQLSQEGQP